MEVASSQVTIPVIDVSLLSSTDPDVRAEAIRALGSACEAWGFFMVVNHEIPETLTNALTDSCDEFFNLHHDDEGEIQKIETKNPRFPIIFKSSNFDAKSDGNQRNLLLWRNYLRFFLHPEFYCPDQPKELSDVVSEYAQKTRILARKIVQCISKSLGMEEGYIEKAMELDSTTQIFAANYYPPCPDPGSTVGLSPHTDPSLLTFVVENGVGGLEIQHEGKWVRVNSIPGSIFVNTGDMLEIVSNSKYKSLLHRAVVNNSKKRISLVVTYSPSPDTIVEPATPLLCGAPARYAPMSYMKYVEVQRSTRCGEKPMLERLKLN